MTPPTFSSTTVRSLPHPIYKHPRVAILHISVIHGHLMPQSSICYLGDHVHPRDYSGINRALGFSYIILLWI